jgi:hypothetical protein
MKQSREARVNALAHDRNGNRLIAKLPIDEGWTAGKSTRAANVQRVPATAG